MNDNKKKRYGVYLIPNLVTTAAMLFGFYAIMASLSNEFERAAICVFVAMILDGLDGRIARLLGSSSSFGEQYDSMSDLLCFGVTPAILIYQWSLSHASMVTWLPERLSWMIPFIFCACAALRLARFNSQIGTTDSNSFVGLPSPASAAVVVGFIWFGSEYQIAGENMIAPSIILTLFAGIMMISPVRYSSFKKFDLKGKIPFLGALLLVLVLGLISVNPATVLWLLFLGYALYSPIKRLYFLLRNRG